MGKTSVDVPIRQSSRTKEQPQQRSRRRRPNLGYITTKCHSEAILDESEIVVWVVIVCDKHHLRAKTLSFERQLDECPSYSLDTDKVHPSGAIQ